MPISTNTAFFKNLICHLFDIFTATDIVRFSLGVGHSMVMRQDGSVWAVGANNYGELGIDTNRNHVINFVEILSEVANAVASGGSHSMLLKQDGSVWVSGRNHYGQLGDGSNDDSVGFVQVIPDGAKAVAAGSKHSLVVKDDGTVWATGCNVHGQLGDGSKIDRNKFVIGLNLQYGVKAVAAGVDHSLVLGYDGSVWGAGSNLLGQLGDRSKKFTSRPLHEGSKLKSSYVEMVMSNAKAIAAGGFHSMVIKEDDTVWVTGNNEFGQLGDGSMRNKRYLRQARNNRKQSFDARAVAAGLYHSVVLAADGEVWVTGGNGFGQLAQSGGHKKTFMPVLRGVQAVAAGGWHTMLRRFDGSFWAAGRNTYGQLGDGSNVNQMKFVNVMRINDDGLYIRKFCTHELHYLQYIAAFLLVTSMTHTPSASAKAKAHMPIYTCACTFDHVLCCPL